MGKIDCSKLEEITVKSQEKLENFEQKIINAVNEKLNDGTVEKLIGQYIEKGVSETLSNMFSYGGDGKKLIEKKLSEVIVPAIEIHDFNRYLTKLDTVLTEIVNSTSLADNKEILENFMGLMREPGVKEIKLSEIFKKYCEHVAENVNTDGLEAFCDDGDPYYGHVSAEMKVEHVEKRWFKSDYDDCIVKFICDGDEDLNCQIKLYKRAGEDKWWMKRHCDPVDISSLRGLSGFEVFLMTLSRAFVKVVLDEESGCDYDIEPNEKPEWDLG